MIYANYTQAELDRQYDAASTVPSLEPFLERYRSESDRTRAEFPNERAAYGSHEREWLELFPAAKPDAPLFVFIHGGYWRRLSADVFSFVAGPVVRAGGACALLNYPLAPAASLDEIVDAARRGFAWAADNAQSRLNASPDRIVAGGHSAGGQLAGMIAAATQVDLRAVFGLSGLYELEPVRRSNVNDWLHLPDAAAAERNSPAMHVPRGKPAVVAAVGQAESDEFRRQARVYADACTTAGLEARSLEAAGHNHYTIVLELGDPASELTALLRGLLGLSG